MKLYYSRNIHPRIAVAVARYLRSPVEFVVAACDKVHFERLTKQRYGLGPIRKDLVAKGLAEFAEAATLLDAYLVGREWLVRERSLARSILGS